jgi:hypothetical protein
MEPFQPEDLEPFKHYLKQLEDDPVRVGVLAEGNFIEEMIELVISEAVPNSECFEVPKMRFADKLKIIRRLYPKAEQTWRIVHALNNLRAAAAHRNYEELRDKRFAELAAEVPTGLPLGDSFDRKVFLHGVAGYCFLHLNAQRQELRKDKA